MNTFFKNSPLIFLGAFLLTLSLNAQPVMKISDTKKSFGFVKQGKLVEIKYEFTNTGNQPLIISDYKVECSCTSLIFPKDPVMPGKSAELIVHFETKSAYDRQDRKVDIISNASNNPQSIRFKGVVLKQ